MKIKDPQKFQKYAFGFIIFLGIFGFLYGIIRFYQNISAPFPGPEGQLATLEGDKSVELEKLKNEDTDQDGITDFDELYLYNTSPYLPDSDSDGKSDQAEIEAGADPNCPEGTDCRGFIANTNENTNLNVNTSSENVDATQLRETLKAAGASETVLNQVDDETLIQIYNEMMAENPELNINSNLNTGSSNSNVNTNTNLSLGEFENLTPQEVRELLKLGGADESILNQIDDATLQEIFNEALKEQGGT